MMRVFKTIPPVPMNARKTCLLGIAFFTVLFMALVLLGSWLLSVESKQFAVAAFLFAFAAVFGQIACLALYVRQTMRAKAAQNPELGGSRRV